MKFLFNLILGMIVVTVLLPIIAYAPVKTFIVIGIWLIICIVLGVLLWMYRNKKRKRKKCVK